uniref:hypothetical protein n=1 Tax=Chloroflexus sp. TaxID=1904827 RepID=UPI002ACDC67D
GVVRECKDLRFQSAMRIFVFCNRPPRPAGRARAGVSIRDADFCFLQLGAGAQIGAADEVSIRDADFCFLQHSAVMPSRWLHCGFNPRCGFLFFATSLVWQAL